MNRIPVNRNFIWTETFVNQLASLGVKYACISPGSRSTPLTISFSRQKKIKCFVHIDERVSGFFALGLAKASNTPVAVVTTSGTATAELYPSIIEAYRQRVPLIICTADRPPEMLNTGANQTITQWNLYKNHIRWFKNVDLPVLTEKKILSIKKIALKAFKVSSNLDKGPVHLNFPFHKPLEPNTFTDEIGQELFDEVYKPHVILENKSDIIKMNAGERKLLDKVSKKIIGNKRGLIIVGPLDYDPELISDIKSLSAKTCYPILADGISHLRFNNSKSNNNICVNYDTFLRSENFKQNFKPDIIIQFGRTPTSTILDDYLSSSNAERFIINKFGDMFDPSGKTKKAIKADLLLFCELLIEQPGNDLKNKRKTNWLTAFQKADLLVEEIKTQLLKTPGLKYEPKIVTSLLKFIPKNSTLMIGNSLPIRDFDWFSGRTGKNIITLYNRGASGIDGITSTALGIAALYKPVILLTGDLSFLHDLNSLIAARKLNIHLIVILINNNGGGIFNALPIASNTKVFKDFFITPHNLNIGSIVNSFGLAHHLIKNETEFENRLISSLKSKSFTVLEIKTDSVLSNKFRKEFRSEVIKKLNKEFSVK